MDHETGKAIGSAMFAREIREAGLDNVPCAWSSDGRLSFHDDVSAEDRAAVIALAEAHNSAAGAAEDAAAADERQLRPAAREAWIDEQMLARGAEADAPAEVKAWRAARLARGG